MTLYAPPLTGTPIDPRIIREPVLEGPTFIRTRTATRWHRVRSSYRWLAEWDESLRQTWSYWCGPSTGLGREPVLTDTPPAGEPLCGSCEGRAIGADPTHPEWLFTPRDLRRPKLCPGSGHLSLAVETTAWNRGRCLVCREDVKLRAFGTIYSPGFGPQRHAPGPGLVDPCVFHGWRNLGRLDDDVVACLCGGQG